MRAEQVTDPITYHGEGPVWAEHWGTAASGLAAGGGLRWVDMLAGDVLSLRADGAGATPSCRSATRVGPPWWSASTAAAT